MDNTKDNREELDIIGSTMYVSIGNHEKIPAKIDTGADSSSVWVSNIEVTEDEKLHFTLFDKKSPLYTGEIIECDDFSVSVIRSSNGTEQIRYRTTIPVKIKGHIVKASMTLSDRSKNHFPILIGRKTLSGRFLVDVSISEVKRPRPNKRTNPLRKELKENPYKFHQKYIKRVDKLSK